MVNAELGTKRNCPSCAGRFYDLNSHPITCPLCSETFVVEPILPSKADNPAPSAPAPVAEPVKAESVDPSTAVDDDDDTDKDDVDDAVAGIEDVDLDDEAEAIGGDDDNTFLDTEDDDEGNVTDIVTPVAKGEEET